MSFTFAPGLGQNVFCLSNGKELRSRQSSSGRGSFDRTASLPGSRLPACERKEELCPLVCPVPRNYAETRATSILGLRALHPMSIEVGCFVGCFSVTKSTVSRNFPAGSGTSPVPLPGGESPDNISDASVARNFSTCFVFLLLTEQILLVVIVIGLQNACGVNAPPR
jgi:hypothetical protein